MLSAQHIINKINDTYIREQSDLLEFLVKQLDERSRFKDVRRVAEKAIQLGMDKSSKRKENWVCSALSELCSLEDTTIEMKKIILQAIEVVMLSRRISDTRSKNIFSKQVNQNSNHVWLMNGAKLLISSFYPELNVEYITVDPKKEDELSNIVTLLQLHGAIWVVVGYLNNYHLSLVRLELDKDNFQVQVLDSIGAVPKQYSDSQTDLYDRALFYLVSFIVGHLGRSIINYSIMSSSDKRQKDRVNCFSFVLNDLEVAESYLSEGKSNFFNDSKNKSSFGSEKAYVLPLLDRFYEISQFQ